MVVSQTMKLESHTPAHTKPVVETVATDVLLDEKLSVGGLLTAAPLEFTTVPETPPTSPRFSESDDGTTLIELGALLELLPPPPHAASTRMRLTRTAAANRRA